MRATRWLVTGQAVAEVEHPQPPLLQVAATAPRRLKCLLRSESETPPHPHARRRLPRAACRLVLFSFRLLHVFFAVMSSAWRGEPPHPLSPSYSPRGVPPPGPPADGKVWSQGLSVSLALCATFFTTELRLRHLLLRHVFSLAGEAPAPPVSLLIHQGVCRPLDPLLLEIASWAY